MRGKKFNDVIDLLFNSFLADRNANTVSDSMIGYWHNTVPYPPVCL